MPEHYPKSEYETNSIYHAHGQEPYNGGGRSGKGKSMGKTTNNGVGHGCGRYSSGPGDGKGAGKSYRWHSYLGQLRMRFGVVPTEALLERCHQ